MPITDTAQLQTLKAAIAADPTLNAIESAATVAALLNVEATPAFVVWRTFVNIADVGKAFNAAELGGLTALNHTRLQTLAIYLSSGVNPGLLSVRTFFDDIFSGAGGVNTRTALAALWKRNAKLVEKIFASGAGTTVSPATLGFEGTVTYTDVNNARNL